MSNKMDLLIIWREYLSSSVLSYIPPGRADEFPVDLLGS